MSFLVALEGIDGSGKGTHAKRLHDRLCAAGRSIKLFSFPRYSETVFAKSIADFLNGRFGELDSVNPFLASLLYAGDRFESRQVLLDALTENDVVLCDRYVPSNIAHQGAKLPIGQRNEFIAWIQRVEYEIYQLPRPNLVLLLDLPASEAQKLITRKQSRDYTHKRADLQEADRDYLEKVRALYLSFAEAGPDWQIVKCLKDDVLRPISDINDEMWQIIDAALCQ